MFKKVSPFWAACMCIEVYVGWSEDVDSQTETMSAGREGSKEHRVLPVLMCLNLLLLGWVTFFCCAVRLCQCWFHPLTSKHGRLKRRLQGLHFHWVEIQKKSNENQMGITASFSKVNSITGNCFLLDMSFCSWKTSARRWPSLWMPLDICDWSNNLHMACGWQKSNCYSLILILEPWVSVMGVYMMSCMNT